MRARRSRTGVLRLRRLRLEERCRPVAPEGALAATPLTRIRCREFQPVSIRKLDNGNYRVDFPVEISGWVKFNNIEGPAGHTIDVSFLSNQYSGENHYTFAGNGPENYSPRFNWFVFSGIEIRNWPGELKASQVTAQAVNTYIAESATFETSNELFQQDQYHLEKKSDR